MKTAVAQLVLALAGAACAQTFCGGLSDPYCDHTRCRLHSYPYEDRCTVRVIDYPPVKKAESLKPDRKEDSNDPLRNRLEKRMAEISADGFIRTNTILIDIAPGLAPKN